MGCSATLSFYDWPLITLVLKAARVFSFDTAERRRQIDVFYRNVYGSTAALITLKLWTQQSDDVLDMKKSRKMSQAARNNSERSFTSRADKARAARSVVADAGSPYDVLPIYVAR